MDHTKTSAFVFYHAPHIDAAVAAHEKGALILATTLWCERLLKARGVPCISARSFVPQSEELDPLLAQVELLAHEWYRIPQMQFFVYKGIRIGEALEPMLDFYLGRFVYHTVLLRRFLAAHPDVETLAVPYIEAENSETAGPLASFERTVVVDAAQDASRSRTNFSALGTRPKLPRSVFPSAPKDLPFLTLYNTLIGLLPRKKVRIFASEYWSHIEPLFVKAHDIEIVFMDRSEIRKIPRAKLLKYRMRFIHPLDIDTRNVRTVSREAQKEFMQQWPAAKSAVAKLPELSFKGTNMWSALEPAFDYLVCHYAERVVADIEGIERILRTERSTKVLLRASIGGRQHHFFLATEVARRLGIPSYELQHANEILDPRSIHSRLAADYLLAYGTGAQEIVEASNRIDRTRIIPVGSPRFDSYLTRLMPDDERAKKIAELQLDLKRPIVLVGMPNELNDLYFVDFDSYAIDDFVRVLRDLKHRQPEIQFIFKFRPGSLTDAYRACFAELFPEGGVYLASRKDPFALLQLSTLALIGNSTLLYEAMIAKVPVLLYPLRPHDTYYRDWFSTVAPAPGNHALAEEVVKILAEPAYRGALLDKQQAFLLAKYAFDGRSSWRIAKIIAK